MNTKPAAHNEDLHGNVPDVCSAALFNDNKSMWRSDYRSIIRHCLSPDAPGRPLVENLVPSSDDYVVLKPKHSAFYATPLEALLSYLKTRTIILTGLTTDACILSTACEIHIRDFDLFVPADCVAARKKDLHGMALKLMTKSFDAISTPSPRLHLKRMLRET
ncbi:MAG TPA: cysteine hydrolase [Terriglobia bacterium]|jgi:nicotinamidase-related amidase